MSGKVLKSALFEEDGTTPLAVGGTTDYNALTNKPTLGTAAAQDVGAFATAAQGTDARTPTAHGHAASDVTGTAVVTNDARLSDARTPVAHTHAPSDVTGTAVVTADSRLSDARTPTAHTHPASGISDSTAAGRALLTAADAPAQRTALGLGTAATTAASAYATAAQAWAPTVSATSATTGTMTVAMGEGVRTITPTGACTFNASGGVAGQRCTFSITTSGTTSFVLTFGTNFRKVGTLATGTTSARFFAVTFVCLNGTIWQEIGRTAVQT